MHNLECKYPSAFTFSQKYRPNKAIAHKNENQTICANKMGERDEEKFVANIWFGACVPVCVCVCGNEALILLHALASTTLFLRYICSKWAQ